MSRPICGPIPCAWTCREAVVPPADCQYCVGGGPGIIRATSAPWGGVGCTNCSDIPTSFDLLYVPDPGCIWEQLGLTFNCGGGDTYNLDVSLQLVGGLNQWWQMNMIFTGASSYNFSWRLTMSPAPHPCENTFTLPELFPATGFPCTHPTEIVLNP